MKIDYNKHYGADFWLGRHTYKAHDGSTQTYIPPALAWAGFEFVASALAPLCPGKTLLDIGCGGGDLARRFEGYGFRPYGIDISEFAVQNCVEDMRGRLALADITTCPKELWAYQGQGQGWEEVSGEGKDWPFPDTYDLVLSTDLAEHLYEEDLDRTFMWMMERTRRWMFLLVAVVQEDAEEFIHAKGAEVPERWETTAVSGHVHVKRSSWWENFFREKGLTLCWEKMYRFQSARERVPAWQQTGGWDHGFTFILEK